MTESGTATKAKRVRGMQKRFALVATAAVAALGAALATTFTADTGSTNISVSAPGGGSSLLFPVASGNSLPSTTDAYIDKTAGKLQNTPNSALSGTGANTSGFNTIGTATTPSWSVVQNSAGNVSTPGDLAVVDADTTDAGSAANVLVTLYLTNLSPLQGDYNSFAWPIDVYKSTDNGDSWTAVTGLGLPQYLTNTSGYLTLTLPTGSHFLYDITMDTGGSYYVINTTDNHLTTNTNDPAPSFYFTIQPLS